MACCACRPAAACVSGQQREVSSWFTRRRYTWSVGAIHRVKMFHCILAMMFLGSIDGFRSRAVTPRRQLETASFSSCYEVTGTNGVADGQYRMCQHVEGEHCTFDGGQTSTTTLLNNMPIYAVAASWQGWTGVGWMWYDRSTSEWRVADCCPLLCRGSKLDGYTLLRVRGDDKGPPFPRCDHTQNPCRGRTCKCCVLLGHESEYQCTTCQPEPAGACCTETCCTDTCCQTSNVPSHPSDDSNSSATRNLVSIVVVAM